MDRVYLSKTFSRSARREGIRDAALKEAVARAEQGKIDVDLGGGLIKQRVARPNEGRSGGFRAIIAYRSGARAVFLHMFAKSKRANIKEDELEILKDFAVELDKLSDADLDRLVAEEGWRKIE
jgi:hypothetical protein